jgi:hypothetical protein
MAVDKTAKGARMAGLVGIWVRRTCRAVPRFLLHVEDNWYGGRAGETISFDPSTPATNPFARGYAQWLAQGSLLRDGPRAWSDREGHPSRSALLGGPQVPSPARRGDAGESGRRAA